ncbi:MAG: VWA domain-containing protein [Candidatus Heimdallarchaeota archaeon]
MPDIYTAEGVRLENVEDYGGDVYPDDDPRTCEYVHFDLTKEQLGKTWRYNCWGFTFLPRRYWINSATDVDNILRDNCDPVPDGSVRIGDVIRYRDDSDKTQHTGRVWQTDGAGHATLIRSKWGSGAEYIHPPLNGSPKPVPAIYGRNLAYFRQRAPLLGISDLWIKDSPEDNGEQFSKSPWWSSPDIYVDAPPYDGIRDTNPVFGQSNRVWALVRNRGDQAANGVHVRYYWVNPAEGLAPEKWHLIPGTPGHPNPVGPFSVPGNSSTEAPYIEWTPEGSPSQLCVIAVAYINDNPQDSNNPDPTVYPFEIRWDNNFAFCEASMLVRPQTQSLNFVDVPEGETTVRALVFSVHSCRSATLQIVDGPNVTSGPAGTNFGTPLGTTTTLDDTTLFPVAAREVRIWVSYTGTSASDSADGTVTIRCVETGEEWTIMITANTVPRPTTAVVLVLDQSNSMTFDSGLDPELPTRSDVLKFSAAPFVEIINEVNAIGVINFDHDAYLRTAVTAVGPPTFGGGRTAARNAIRDYAPNPEGWTSIGDGLELSHNELTPVTGYDSKATIILTDGHENRPKYIADVTDLINERVYAIGLGTAEVIQPAALTALTNGTGGYILLTGELSDDFFRLAKYYMQILAGVTNQDVVLDPDGWLISGDTHRIPFQLSETDISADVILLSTHPALFTFLLEAPNGQIIDPATASASPIILYATGSNVSYYRIGLPVPFEGDEVREGTWYVLLRIEAQDKLRRYKSQAGNPSSLHETEAVLASIHGLRYNLSVHTYSNLRMSASEFQTSHELGGIMSLRTVLKEYSLPVGNRATVRVRVERPDFTMSTLNLPEVEPGVFETSIPASIPGVYRFRIHATGTTLQGNPFTREQTLTGAVYRGGDISSPTSKDDPFELFKHLCRLRCFRIVVLLLVLLVFEALLALLILLR